MSSQNIRDLQNLKYNNNSLFKAYCHEKRKYNYSCNEMYLNLTTIKYNWHIDFRTHFAIRMKGGEKGWMGH